MLSSKHAPTAKQSFEKAIKPLKTDYKVRIIASYIEFLRDERYRRLTGALDNTELLLLTGELKALQKLIDVVSLSDADPLKDTQLTVPV